ncbi:hypothetical protein ABIC38_006793 [Variovorax sp. 1126]
MNGIEIQGAINHAKRLLLTYSSIANQNT